MIFGCCICKIRRLARREPSRRACGAVRRPQTPGVFRAKRARPRAGRPHSALRNPNSEGPRVPLARHARNADARLDCRDMAGFLLPRPGPPNRRLRPKSRRAKTGAAAPPAADEVTTVAVAGFGYKACMMSSNRGALSAGRFAGESASPRDWRAIAAMTVATAAAPHALPIGRVRRVGHARPAPSSMRESRRPVQR